MVTYPKIEPFRVHAWQLKEAISGQDVRFVAGSFVDFSSEQHNLPLGSYNGSMLMGNKKTYVQVFPGKPLLYVVDVDCMNTSTVFLEVSKKPIRVEVVCLGDLNGGGSCRLIGNFIT